MLFKSVIRTIKRSFDRYLAILTIIALGVGFFAGLKVTETAMLKTADSYITELRLYDFKLISTLGFTESDVKSFDLELKKSSACGSISYDVVYKDSGGSDKVLHAHSISDEINLLDIKSGRLPMKDNECVIDAKVSGTLKMGDKMVLTDTTPEENLQKFKFREYTVVGTVNSPVYMNFDRGSTSLAGGAVSGYVYILPSGFDSEIYTEVYIKLPYGGRMYSKEYTNSVDRCRDEVSKLLEERAQLRKKEITDSAMAEIDKAKAEIEEKSAELEAHERETENGYEAYYSEKRKTEKALADGKLEIDNAANEIVQTKTLIEQLKAAQQSGAAEVAGQIAYLETQVTSAEAVLVAKREEYETAKAIAQSRFAETEQRLNSAKEKIASGRQELETAKKEIEEKEEEVKGIDVNTYLLDRNSNVGYACFENDTGIVSGVAKVFPLFFFLVAALVCITTMTRMISEMRTENGVLKALGYSEAAIAAQYLFYAGSASTVGCVAGFLLGSKLLPLALWQVYHILYSIQRPIEFVLDKRLFAVCFIMYMLCSLGTTWYVCKNDLRESSAQLIRPKAPAAGKRIFLEKIGFLWSRMKFLHKVSARNILRYKKRMFMMIIGVGGCMALLMVGFGIRDSIQPILDYQYSEITLYDASVNFSGELDGQQLSEFKGGVSDIADNIEYAYTESVDIEKNGVQKPINLVLFEDSLKNMIDLHSDDEKIDWPKANEAVINYRFAKENNIKKGDNVKVRDSNNKTLEFKVSGIYDNYIYDYIYVSRESYESLSGRKIGPNIAYIIFNGKKESREYSAELLNMKSVVSVNITEDMISRVGSMLDSLDYIVLIVLVCAGALAFIVLYNLTNIMITERTREIATLKVLGFYLGEQNSYVFRENFVITLLSIICGIPMGLALLWYVMDQIKIGTFYFGCRLAPLSFVLSAVITILFAVFVDFIMTFKNKKINMAEALKAVD